MYRKSLLIFTICLIFHFSFTQNNHEFLGAVKLNDTLSITYRLNLTETNGNISGYSLTDLGGEHETKSNIIGNYDIENKTLNFKEVSVIYTKSPVSLDEYDFCFINVSLKPFILNKAKTLRTNFKGFFSDNVKCIDGELLLQSIKKVEKRVEKIAKKIEKTKKINDSIKQKINPIKLMDSLKMNILRKEETLSFFSKSNQIKMIIYDGGKEDGDRITISVNGRDVITSYEANNQKKIIPINLDSKKTSVVIKAENEGSIAPNTIVVEIDDNNNLIKGLSNLKRGQTTQIDILKKE